MNDSIILGVDIGGSHITAALVDMQSRTILPESMVREAIDAYSTATDIIAQWSKIMKASFSISNTSMGKIGIAMPGPFDYAKGICLIKGQEKYEALYGLNIKEMLAEKLEISPNDILLMNDAACFLQGEVFSGAATECRNVIGLTLGTGLGSASYHGEVAEDADLWKMPFKDTYAEEYLSTRWFVKRYYELTAIEVSNVKELAACISEDTSAKVVFDEFGRNLGDFLNRFIEQEKAELIVIGGNIAKAFDLFIDELLKVVAVKFPEVDVKLADLGEQAPLLGSASLWFDYPLGNGNNGLLYSELN
ncbi:MAG: ROK family protein [Candidatus Pedobacter colombiensis]|uniref:ROK family protein n=1 Tax=Candidatus Pedobacter colombiensis TaxID=3121371 RepID=A0AAJ5WAC7_9SPHI|nr:ROK family protein [Pedobacter sp.]WEK19960.1 MAG: ROK family protein [Pedobacter sp.]